MVIKQVMSGSIQYPKGKWKKFSEKTKEFVQKILVSNYKKRITIQELIENEYFTKDEDLRQYVQ